MEEPLIKNPKVLRHSEARTFDYRDWLCQGWFLSLSVVIIFGTGGFINLGYYFSYLQIPSRHPSAQCLIVNQTLVYVYGPKMTNVLTTLQVNDNSPYDGFNATSVSRLLYSERSNQDYISKHPIGSNTTCMINLCLINSEGCWDLEMSFKLVEMPIRLSDGGTIILMMSLCFGVAFLGLIFMPIAILVRRSRQ